MALGPGKYDHYCCEVLEKTKAAGVILIVVDGIRGSGFSVVTVDDALNPRLPALLRSLALGVEADLKNPI